MADRVKVWDVKDDKSLRRAIGANDHYVDDGYYNHFISGGSGYTTGTVSSLHSRLSTTILRYNQDDLVRYTLPWPEFWSYGKITAKNYFLHNAAQASGLGDVRLNQTITGYQIPDNGSGIANVNFTSAPYAETITFTTFTGAFTQGITWTVETTSGAKLRTSRNVIGVLVKRNGTHAADTYGDDTDAGALHWIGTLITWKPEHRAE